MNFVDIHSHFLHGLDDGAKTREDSVAMLQIAARSGTTDIVATPHADGKYTFKPELVAQRIDDLRAATPVRLHTGCDFHLQVDNIQDAIAHPEKYSINHAGYLLVEFPHGGVFSSTDEILAQLLSVGLVPIISHPERNGHLQRRFDDLARWIETGCYVQVTAASYLGLFGKAAKEAAYAMTDRGLTHFVASDAHDTTVRTPSLLEAYQLLADRWGEPAIRPLFVENPRAVLTGTSVDFELPSRDVTRRKWYHFWG